MFLKLTLTNFQTHKKLVVEFDPHVTSIVGPNSAGKSTILRALQWACLNRPSGVRILRDGTSFCKVELEVKGAVIKRKRSSKVNEYYLNGKKLKAFSSEVPEEIQTILNVSDLNFQNQLDQPFWFCETAGQVGKQLNQIVNLGVIDSSLAFIAAELREAKACESVTTSRLKEARNKKKELAWVPKFQEEAEKLQELEEELESKQGETAVLSTLVSNVDSLENRLHTLGQAKVSGRKLLAIGDRLQQKKEQKDKLLDLIEEMEDKEAILSRYIPDIKKMEEVVLRLEKVNASVFLLKDLIASIRESEELICRLKKESTQASSDLSELMDGEVCPVCGQEMK